MELNANETIAQLGGRGLSGALVYTGTTKMYMVDANKDGYKEAMWFKVNGKRGWQTFIEVKLEPSDTYTVTLMNKRGAKPHKIRNTKEDVYCDELKTVFEEMYDKHMREFNNGFIPG